MTDFTRNLNDSEITEVLTNATKVIQYEDKDFVSIIQSLGQISENDKGAPTLSGLEITGRKEESIPNTFDSISESHGEDLSDGSRVSDEGGRREIFPMKLYRLLEKSDVCGYSSIISWLSHGHAFKIHDEDLFQKYVLNKYYTSKLESFKRQLYNYGFKKVGKQFSDAGAYYHYQFVSGQFVMCCDMKRCDKKRVV